MLMLSQGIEEGSHTDPARTPERNEKGTVFRGGGPNWKIKCLRAENDKNQSIFERQGGFSQSRTNRFWRA